MILIETTVPPGTSKLAAQIINEEYTKRGISFNSRSALSAHYNDGWLRLNQGSSFTNGVYTPGKIRADGGFHVGSITVINSSGQIAYSRLTSTPSIPTVNNSTITFQRNGVTIGTMTLNQTNNETFSFTDTNTTDIPRPPLTGPKS